MSSLNNGDSLTITSSLFLHISIPNTLKIRRLLRLTIMVMARKVGVRSVSAI